jgi:class 3 adenylate cyclase
MKRKIAALMAADIAGYSRLVAEDEEETLRRLASYRAVMDDFIAKASGRIFNTAGDAVMAEFPSAVEAVRCAIDVQESLRTRNLAYPPSRQMQFRIGITVGDIVERDGDLLGDAVNISARLEGLAEPGGICVSRSVFEQVSNKLSVQFADIGEQQVKNIPTPVHAYVVAVRGADGYSLPPKPRSPALPVAWMAVIAVAVLAAAGGATMLYRAQSAPPTEVSAKIAPAPEARAATPQNVTSATPSPIAAPQGATSANGRSQSAAPLPAQTSEPRVAAVTPTPQLVRLNETHVRALAAQQNIPLPETLSLQAPPETVPKRLAAYIGVWGGEGRWNGVGRQLMLIITNVNESPTVVGFLANGPPNSYTSNQSPAAYRPFTGTISDDGLSFDLFGGKWRYMFKMRPDGLLEGHLQGPNNLHASIAVGRIE